MMVKASSKRLTRWSNGNPYAAAGVDEVQAVLDPIDRPSIERFAQVVPLLDRA